MLHAVGRLLPIAVAYALSSVPISATLLILLSPRRTGSAAAFLSGWLLGIIGMTAAATVTTGVAHEALPRSSGPILGILEILIGLVLIVMAVATVLRRDNRKRQDGRFASWLGRTDSLSLPVALTVGLVLNLRPKAIILSIAAGLVLADGGRLVAVQLVSVLLIYTAIAGSTVGLPVVATLLAPDRWEPRLVLAQDWMSRHGGVMAVVILFMVGTVVLGLGLANLPN